MTILIDGYWCEAIARSSDAGREWALGGYRANSPRLAMRWLRGQAARLANALDPVPGVGPIPTTCLREVGEVRHSPGRAFREWLADHPYQGIQASALVSGRHISVNAGGPDGFFGDADADVFYFLSARPISIGFLTDWKPSPPHYAMAP